MFCFGEVMAREYDCAEADTWQGAARMWEPTQDPAEIVQLKLGPVAMTTPIKLISGDCKIGVGQANQTGIALPFPHPTGPFQSRQISKCLGKACRVGPRRRNMILVCNYRMGLSADG